VTLLVKDNIPGQITLAIGDGANDVSMIQVPETERGETLPVEYACGGCGGCGGCGCSQYGMGGVSSMGGVSVGVVSVGVVSVGVVSVVSVGVWMRSIVIQVPRKLRRETRHQEHRAEDRYSRLSGKTLVCECVC
jgi:hypothetical protein